MKTILFHHTGPMIRYGDGLIHVSDLNPQVETKWRMSRMEMIGLGLRAIWAAISR